MKKRLLFILMTAAAVIMLSAAVSAEDYTASPYREEIAEYDEVLTKIYQAALHGEARISLTEYKVRDYELMRIYSDLIAAAPELFYLDSRVIYYHNTKYVTEIELIYTMTEAERETASVQYEKELAYIVSMIDPGMSEAEKALWVHDYLISVSEYDEDGTYYDAYSLFTQRKGVCQAYSLAYAAVMRELGINCVMISSSEMNHAWNLVEIDGEWYHVDLVFDDPTPDRLGRVLHENFLLSDDAIQLTKDPHYAWTSIIQCKSDTYTDAIWNGVKSRMVHEDRRWYYIDEEAKTLVSSRINGELRSTLYTFSERWYVGDYGGQYWVGVFSGLSEYLGHIFVNTPYEVIIYTPKTGVRNVYLEAEGEQNIYGIEVYKGTLEYLMAESPKSREGSAVNEFIITDFDDTEYVRMFPFDDVIRLDGYYAAVKYVYNMGLFAGVSSTKFAPDATLTRAMFITVLGRLCKVNTDEYSRVIFDDVAEGEWYSPYVEWAAECGIVNGVGDNKFDPFGEITHEQMYKIIAKCGQELIGDKSEPVKLMLFADRDEVSDWAVDSVAYCIENGLIDQDTEYLHPKADSTRAEAAVIIAKFAAKYGGYIEQAIV